VNRAELIEIALKEHGAILSDSGALVVRTGKKTGRSTRERYIIERPSSEQNINWGKTNQPINAETAEFFFNEAEKHFQSISHHRFDGYVGAFDIEVLSTSSWHVLFCDNMFRQEKAGSLQKLNTGKKIRVLHLPEANASNLCPGYSAETLIILDPDNLKVLIIGTGYAGEIKKSAFTLCNYALVEKNFLPMHASANCLEDGSESCVLFGLSGTGKTTLSADSSRFLIGDDEILWTPYGISNLEGGCYAKLIDLSSENEPEIYSAVNRNGAIMENINFYNGTREVNFKDTSLTENTRGSYPLHALGKVYAQNKEAEQPKNIVFLTADAFGALPAVARLNPFQAQYHFMSGYTAKVSGTEMGVTEPEATFSACFGAPFMPRKASVYASLLSDYAERNNANFWLLNTGWTGGDYTTGSRFPISVSRRILTEIQSGSLSTKSTVTHPTFGFEVPQSCDGIDSKWLSIPDGKQVSALAEQFVENVSSEMPFVGADVVSHGGPTLR
jgi:phosphoenolpyruvate carboxykinase (ATP)